MGCDLKCCSCSQTCGCGSLRSAGSSPEHVHQQSPLPDTDLQVAVGIPRVPVPPIYQSTLVGVESASPAAAVLRANMSHQFSKPEQADVALTFPDEKWWVDAVGHRMKATVLRRRHLTAPASDPQLSASDPNSSFGPRFVALFALPVSFQSYTKIAVQGGTVYCTYVPPQPGFIRGIKVVLLAVQVPGFVFQPQKRVIATATVGFAGSVDSSGAIAKQPGEPGPSRWMVPLKMRPGVENILDPMRDMAYFLCYLHNDAVADAASFDKPPTDSSTNNCAGEKTKSQNGVIISPVTITTFPDFEDYQQDSDATNSDPSGASGAGSSVASQPATELDEVALHSIRLWWTPSD